MCRTQNCCFVSETCFDVKPSWRYQMETFPRYWPFVRGIHRSHVNSPHKGQWRGALMFSLICAWINGWVNNHKVGNLRRHSAHYDVTVMLIPYLNLSKQGVSSFPRNPLWAFLSTETGWWRFYITLVAETNLNYLKLWHTPNNLVANPNHFSYYSNYDDMLF